VAYVDGPVRVEHLGQSTAPDAALDVVGTDLPRISWRLISEQSGWIQDRVELRAVHSGGFEEAATVVGNDQVLVPWPFAPLRSRQRVSVAIRAYGSGQWTDWSEPLNIEAGLLRQDDWTAHWITDDPASAIANVAPILGTNIDVRPGLARARLYITALGVAIPRIGGRRVSADHFSPGWSTYDKSLRYQAYDITNDLVEGENRFDVILGNGWYRGRIASLDLHRGAPYGETLGLLAQVELSYADGEAVVVATNSGWMSAPSQILENDFYDGQATDLRISDVPDLSGGVTYMNVADVPLTAPVAPPVRELQVVPAVSISIMPNGRTLVDFGRNIVGWVRLTVRGNRGDEVTIRHAEVLEDGELSIRPLRTAKATDRYVLAGEGPELLEPSLTFHGFRYAEIDSVAAIGLGDASGVVLGSNLERTGWFSSTHPGLNQLHQNVVNSMQGNFLDIPTDCPQRDERLGWTGDIQVFAPTASALFDVNGFLDSWLATLAKDQLEDGTVPLAIPRVFSIEQPTAGWGDAAVIVPWVLYERFGDLGILARQFESMVAWVRRVERSAGPGYLWAGESQLGDWLDPLAPPENPASAQADPDVVATAYFARSAELLSKSAHALGRTEDAQYFGDLANAVRSAFVSAYVAEDGMVLSDCQTVYSLALHWNLIEDPDVRNRAAHRLAALVTSQGYRIATGFLGTPVVLDALVDSGNSSAAYRMLLNREFPSWLYSVDMGATTIWERWDSLLPDGRVNPGAMTSFNHYAFGAVADWMHRNIGGLSPLAPGYRAVLIAPLLTDEIDGARVAHLSPYGMISATWQKRAGQLFIDVEVPVGVTATVSLPDGSDSTNVGCGAHSFVCDIGHQSQRVGEVALDSA
jgi:alpha-L-rhamnosidase